jgi:hypothetical protein
VSDPTVNSREGAARAETATVGVRLRGDVWARYSAEAQAAGVPLGTYLRRRLEEQDGIAASLDALRTAVERAALVAPPPTVLPPQLEGTIVELLLLLRSIAYPQKTAMVHAEVTRRGLETWG